MLKKIIAIVCTAILTATAMVGCGNDKSNEGTSFGRVKLNPITHK